MHIFIHVEYGLNSVQSLSVYIPPLYNFSLYRPLKNFRLWFYICGYIGFANGEFYF